MSTSTADNVAQPELHHNFATHKAAWRSAIEFAIQNEKDSDQRAYWEHELKAYDEAFGSLAPIDPALADRDFSGYRAAIETLEWKLGNAQRELEVRRLHDKADVWYWQGDGGDNLDSMSAGMIVVIRADQLRAVAESKTTDMAMFGGKLPTPFAYIWPEKDNRFDLCLTPSGPGDHFAVFTETQVRATIGAALFNATGEVAGYQMISRPEVFYPASHKPTDINNFRTVYAEPVKNPHRPTAPLIDRDRYRTYVFKVPPEWKPGQEFGREFTSSPYFVGAYVGNGLDERSGIAAFMASTTYPGKIPQGVYYCAEHDNFYSMTNEQGMGQGFYERWMDRKGEFPIAPLKEHQSTGGASDASRFQRAIDARYPIPYNTDDSIVQAVMSNREAFWYGWNDSLNAFSPPTGQRN